MIRFGLLLVVVVSLGAVGCESSEPGVVVFVAASAGDAVEELAEVFEADTGVSVSVSAAGSSVLARQIESGANAAVFLSANVEWVEHLASQGMVEERVDLLGNALVAVVPKGSVLGLNEAAELAGDNVGSIAVADTDGVPAGQYAKRALTALGIWEGVESKLVPAADVRQALVYVERGEADVGLVYASDAAASERVDVAFRFAESDTGPIVYPLVLTSADPDARRFYEFLQTPDARGVFESHGFRVR